MQGSGPTYVQGQVKSWVVKNQGMRKILKRPDIEVEQVVDGGRRIPVDAERARRMHLESLNAVEGDVYPERPDEIVIADLRIRLRK